MILTLKNISKSFTQRGLVLDNLDLDLAEGESVAIMGPSGSGKTTLMNIIGLLDKPDQGVVNFRGSDTATFNSDKAAHYRNMNIGFVFQDHLMLPHLTVQENILLPLLAFPRKGKEMTEKKENAIKLMKFTGIADLSGKYPSEISGGEAQRAALVRALVNNPALLLADEPTGSLDSKNADILGDLLLELNRESRITLLLATHSEKLAGKMSKRMKLADGKLIAG